MTLYNAKGEAFKVPHAIDVKDWLASGQYTEKNPKADTKTESKKDSRKD